MTRKSKRSWLAVVPAALGMIYTSAAISSAQPKPFQGPVQVQVQHPVQDVTMGVVIPQITATPTNPYYSTPTDMSLADGSTQWDSQQQLLAISKVQQAWADLPNASTTAPIVAVIDSGVDPSNDFGAGCSSGTQPCRLLSQIDLYPTNTAPSWSINYSYPLASSAGGTYSGSLVGPALQYTLTVTGTGTSGGSTPFSYTSTDPNDPSGTGVATNGQASAVGTEGVKIDFASATTYPQGTQYQLTGADDDIQHGTYVAQMVAGGTGSNSWTTGVCPQCYILPIRAGGWAAGNDTSEDFSSWTVAQAIIDAANYPGVQVINLSLGGAGDPPDAALSCPGASTLGAEQCAVDYAISKGITVVASAGNLGTDEQMDPAAESNVISVGAVDATGDMETWSEHDGPGSNWIQVAAPGCYPVDMRATIDTTGLGLFCGTSGAAPFTAGVAALVYMAGPSVTPAQVQTAVEQGADLPVAQLFSTWYSSSSDILGTTAAGKYAGTQSNPSYTLTVGAGATTASTPFSYTSNDPNDPSGSATATNGSAGAVGT
ncbi:MAG TPA: S8 family serine peptidase, partial [Acidimicrobiales bacterium]|nr:S8 family serine peptidase [Acidimicrobiales bacterium]